MKVLVLFGSPRKEGNTASLLKPVIDELKTENADISYFDAYDMNVKGCNACLKCQKDIENICCTIDDDMKKIFREIVDSNVILIASPIYAWSIPAPLKAIIDRLVYSSCKYYDGNPNGPALLGGKKLYLLLTCGYPIEKGTDLLEEAMKRYAKHLKLTYSGMLAFRQRNLNEPFMDSEKEKCAREFAHRIMDYPL